MRELVKVMGLRDSIHQFSWFVTGFMVFSWIAISTAYICSISFLPKSNFLLLFLFFFLFAMSEITLSMLLSTLFSNSKLAAMVAPVLLFCLLLPRYIFFTTNTNEQIQPKYYSSLLSPVAFAFGAYMYDVTVWLCRCFYSSLQITLPMQSM